MHLGCVTVNYKHPLRVSSKCIIISKSTIFLAQNGLITRLGPDGRVYEVLTL